MKTALIVTLSILTFLLVLTLFSSIIAYYMCFYNNLKGADRLVDELNTEQFKPYFDKMQSLIKEAYSVPYDEDINIKSYDGLNLHGRFYKCEGSNRYSIMFHGYKGEARRDFSGGVKENLSLGLNLYLVDQRGHGESDGRTITFGVKERLDLKRWVDYVIEKHGENIEILLEGISMGAATVLFAADFSFPKAVKGIFADSPYTTPKDITMKVAVEDMHIPRLLAYYLLSSSAFLIAHFKFDSVDARETVKNSKLPILIIHGKEDRYVPHEMSEEIQASNPNNIELLEIDGAGHAIPYIVDHETYMIAFKNFLNRIFE
ncbi:alpha/beta hydrolase [bacterium]|nr:alpha/beta hydrolase [bacterium]